MPQRTKNIPTKIKRYRTCSQCGDKAALRANSQFTPFCRPCAQTLRHILGSLKYAELKAKTELIITHDGIEHCLKCKKPMIHAIKGKFCRNCKARISDYERNHLENNA